MANRIQGTVVEVNGAGDLITDIVEEKWVGIKRTFETKIVVDDEHETFGLFDSNHQQPPMTLIAIVESNRPLRLHLVADSASAMLGVSKGAKVEILW
ncbi:MAG: adenosylmethionine-8-amino-7-oxononanoate aminotransferase [Pirellula staleyi]